MDILKQLNWRYAIKKFDKSKKLSKEQLDLLIDAVRMAPTSYGVQPFELYVIEDAAVREKLSEAAYGQPQVTEASQVFVFAAKKDVTVADIEEYVARTATVQGVTVEDLKGFRDMMVGSLEGKSPEERFNWAARQVYITLGFLLTTAAMGAIDACPMEGFDNNGFDEILGLKEKGLNAVVMATVGFRSDEDVYSKRPKVRKELKDFVTKV
ncbi:NAD(P)H-dependent oxidoreductase [Alkalitalea saponilacus]|uniref:Nitroreductase n=1 Tax=Alkalitalea saponilacus TaxID=889453 RepID=A0A1T5H8L3_9BACT|nr:NAD(P)H-dependent oxidoreductase [Alkalitalea saponilacus]ASB50836.1 NAD(P)H-dependent oxidoreductase [Alkalitalea saponilacus]SKC17007.1 Nitroreductase [Alkalitalea saponilacus]